MNENLIKFLESNGYFNLKEIPGCGLCGLMRFAYTTGLVIGLAEYDYYGRYCFHSLSEAKSALEKWDGEGDPSGEWIKYKGTGGERSRIKDKYEED